MTSKRAAPRLQTPVARAWRRYYRETKELHGDPYEDAEPWAWEKLQEKILKIKRAKKGST